MDSVKIYLRKKRKRLLLLFLLLGVLLSCAGLFCIRADRIAEETELREQMRGDLKSNEIKALLQDFTCFPLRDTGVWYFENGYGAARSYGGKRKHEGIDIIPKDKKENFHPVISVSDGVIEQIGWLELGGYRIGIRSHAGFYYYYAHLASYEKGMKKGTKVKAGDVLGYMGSTGYGTEGTKGKFITHLHFGIYRQVKGKEKSINPYYLLRWSFRRRQGNR